MKMKNKKVRKIIILKCRILMDNRRKIMKVLLIKKLRMTLQVFVRKKNDK